MKVLSSLILANVLCCQVAQAFVLTPTRPSSRVVLQQEVASTSTMQGAQAISALTKDVKTLQTSTEIDAILPHRYPFALVDKVVELEPGKRAVGVKAVTKNEEFFQGHFPGQPVMPGTLLHSHSPCTCLVLAK